MRIRATIALTVLLAGCVVALVAEQRTTPWIVGWGIAGVGAVLLVGLLFYEIGRSEDRARERGEA